MAGGTIMYISEESAAVARKTLIVILNECKGFVPVTRKASKMSPA